MSKDVCSSYIDEIYIKGDALEGNKVCLELNRMGLVGKLVESICVSEPVEFWD